MVKLHDGVVVVIEVKLPDWVAVVIVVILPDRMVLIIVILPHLVIAVNCLIGWLKSVVKLPD